MHNSFILQQYVCYITILNMFRAVPCSSSGGQIVLLQPLVSSLSVNSRTVCQLRADLVRLVRSQLWCTVGKTSNYTEWKLHIYTLQGPRALGEIHLKGNELGRVHLLQRRTVVDTVTNLQIAWKAVDVVRCWVAVKMQLASIVSSL